MVACHGAARPYGSMPQCCSAQDGLPGDTPIPCGTHVVVSALVGLFACISSPTGPTGWANVQHLQPALGCLESLYLSENPLRPLPGGLKALPKLRSLMWHGASLHAPDAQASAPEGAVGHGDVSRSPRSNANWPEYCVACKCTHLLGDAYQCYQQHRQDKQALQV